MLIRRLEAQIRADLRDQAAVALLGPRQVGKTTLALAIAEGGPSIYLDLEDPADRDKLADPALYLTAHEDKLVIIDEIQNAPDLFSTLRGLIDKGRRKGVSVRCRLRLYRLDDRQFRRRRCATLVRSRSTAATRRGG